MRLVCRIIKSIIRKNIQSDLKSHKNTQTAPRTVIRTFREIIAYILGHAGLLFAFCAYWYNTQDKMCDMCV